MTGLAEAMARLSRGRSAGRSAARMATDRSRSSCDGRGQKMTLTGRSPTRPWRRSIGRQKWKDLERAFGAAKGQQMRFPHAREAHLEGVGRNIATPPRLVALLTRALTASTTRRKMAPQTLEMVQFTPENGMGLGGRGHRISSSCACRRASFAHREDSQVRAGAENAAMGSFAAIPRYGRFARDDGFRGDSFSRLTD